MSLKRFINKNGKMRKTAIGNVYIPNFIPVSGRKVKNDLPPIANCLKSKSKGRNMVVNQDNLDKTFEPGEFQDEIGGFGVKNIASRESIKDLKGVALAKSKCMNSILTIVAVFFVFLCSEITKGHYL